MARDITRRLQALGHAHELIRPSLRKHRKALQLRELLAALLAAYDERGKVGDRICIDVPDVLVGEAAITTVALAIHELATNSIKYGSLSSATGSVDISCSVEDGDVIVVWMEKGGPPVTVPRGQAGFGSKLVHTSITGQLGGLITSEWPTEGAIVTQVRKALLGS